MPSQKVELLFEGNEVAATMDEMGNWFGPCFCSYRPYYEPFIQMWGSSTTYTHAAIYALCISK